RDRAVTITETLRTDVARSETDTALHRRARWHGVGAAALTAVIAVFGCALLWLVFDRELRRSWKARTRLAESEQRYRGLIENGADYGVWHDVELQCEAHPQENVMIVRVRDVRETPEFKAPKPVEKAPQPTVAPEQLQEAEARIAALERERDALRDREQAARTEL